MRKVCIKSALCYYSRVVIKPTKYWNYQLEVSYSVHNHPTHTHTHIYIYICLGKGMNPIIIPPATSK